MPERYADLLPALHPEPRDAAEALLAAAGTSEMRQAAHRLRATALSVRRQISGPRSEDALLGLGSCGPDPEPGLAELADLAVDVVTAVDYLLRLLDAPLVPRPQLTLAGDGGSGLEFRPACDNSLDWLIRKQLDARGAAVRVGTRLVSGLFNEISG